MPHQCAHIIIHPLRVDTIAPQQTADTLYVAMEILSQGTDDELSLPLTIMEWPHQVHY